MGTRPRVLHGFAIIRGGSFLPGVLEARDNRRHLTGMVFAEGSWN